MYQFTVGSSYEIPLCDDMCNEVDIKTGDILICEPLKLLSGLTLRKYDNQSLTDEEILNAGHLTRVFKISS